MFALVTHTQPRPQAQRLRLVADSELKLEAAEAGRREDKRRAEEAAAAAAEALRVLESQLREEHTRCAVRVWEGCSCV